VTTARSEDPQRWTFTDARPLVTSAFDLGQTTRRHLRDEEVEASQPGSRKAAEVASTGVVYDVVADQRRGIGM
jgi:hypothetical protein